MPVFLIILLLGVLTGTGALIIRLRRAARRSQARQKTFPEEWVQVLQRNLPVYASLPATLRRELHREIHVFLAEKSFEGCGGLVLTDEIRITLAAQACLLLLNRTSRGYPALRTVVVYPGAYVAGGKGLFADKGEASSVRLGESWTRGSVVLAWDSARRGALNFRDGKNVTMHEFAHQLDQEDGLSDGAPVLGERSAFTSWARVFSREFEQLQHQVKGGRPSVLDAYGATNPAEFFAVATETFYEKPRQLQKKHPDLYRELQRFYRVNPAAWV